MPESDESTSADATLGLTRWETRFTEAETEARYRDWQLEQAVPFNRAGMLASIVLWSIVVISLLALSMSLFWVLVILLVMMPALLVSLFTTFRRPLHRWMQLCVSLTGTLAGLLIVGIVNTPKFAVEASIGAVLIVNYFDFAINRIRLAQAAISTTPYIALEIIILGRSFWAGRLAAPSLVVDVIVLSMGFCTGVMINAVSDVVSRRSYRQERIIERQKDTIARERARSEGLLKSELSHQVAERSRELGAALMQVGSPKVVALPIPGERFSRYRVVRSLGEGGMGAVFEVTRLTDSQHLALKLVTGNVSGEAAARVAREAEIGARVHHPNLVSIVDVGIAEGGAPYLVMDLVHGGSLESRRNRFGDVAWGLPILKQIALGLSVLHTAGVVHRDLKPGNVLLDGDDEAAPIARISDFGISRFGRLDAPVAIDPEGPTVAPATPKKDLTKTGAFLGTPLYMAPEAARGGKSLDAAADVFAFGILAYEVLTGQPPFAMPAVLVALSGRPLPTPAPIDVATLDARTCDIVLACLAEDPKARPSALRICDTLRR